MTDILQIWTISNSFSGMDIMNVAVFWFKFELDVFLSQQSSSIGSDNPVWRQAFIWGNASIVHWCICTSLDFDELIMKGDDIYVMFPE